MRAASRLLLAIALTGCREQSAPRTTRPDASVQDASIVVADASVPGDDAGVVAPAPAEDPAMPTAPAFDVEFTHRLRHLLDAISTNDAALCHDVQLPRKAYVDDYVSKNLVKTWDHGVDAAFKKALGKLHRRHRRVELAFVSLEVPKAMELTPAREREGFRVALWRVAHAKLHAKPTGQAPGDGKDISIDLGCLVYWRGAWYVERL